MYWIYWENKKNKKIPYLVVKCLRKMKEKLKNITFLNEKNIKKYINVIDTSRIAHIAQKVDYYRSKILYEYGGIWLDIDTIVIHNLDYLIEELNKSEKEVMLSISELNSSLPSACIQYMIAKPKSLIMKKWYLECERIIKSKKYIRWADLGGHLLAKIINENKLHDLILPFSDKIVFRYGYKNYLSYYKNDISTVEEELKKINNNQYKIIVLYGTFMYDKIIKKDMLLFKLFDL